MTAGRRVAVTGAGGRLGRALLDALRSAGAIPTPWSRPQYDLDEPGDAARLVADDPPEIVFHAAAWTDVDGCARDPATAHRRNGAAVGTLATACRGAGVDLVCVSTNEVFDGGLFDRRGYRESDGTNPINAYGASKLEGERLAARAYGWKGRDAATEQGPRLWIIRTAWLFGPPGADFPAKILAAADRLPAGEPVSVVVDEIGSPTYTPDLAAAIVALVDLTPPGIYHLAGSPPASRHEWAARVLARCRPERQVRPIGRGEFQRASTPPAWAVLDAGKAASHGIELRPWQPALDSYLPVLCPQ